MGAVDAALHLAPESLNSVRVNLAPRPFPTAMRHSLMRVVSAFPKSAICRVIVRHYRGAGCDRPRNDWQNCCRPRVLYNCRRNIAAAFQDAKHGRFSVRSAPAFSGALSSTIRFIQFNRSLKRRRLFAHQFTNLVHHSPRAFICDPDMSLKLQCRNSIFARGHVENRQVPRSQGRGRFVKNRSGCRIGLKSAVANVGAAIRHRAKAVFPSAFFTRQPVRIAVPENVGQASGVFRKLRIKLPDRVSLDFCVDLRISHVPNYSMPYLSSRDIHLILQG